MDNKKILFISNIAPPKVGSFSLASIYASKNLGLEYHLASNFKDSSKEQMKIDEVNYNIKLHQIDFERNPISKNNKKAYYQLLELMKKEKFDIVHCNTPVGGLLGRWAAYKCHVSKVIYQVHGFHFYKGASILNWMIFYPIERFLAHYTDKLITINKEDYFRAQSFKLRNKGKVYYVPGVGIKIDEFQNLKVDKINELNKFGLSENNLILIAAGRLDKNKNNNTLIKSLALTQDENIHLLLCGSGEQENELKILAKQLGIVKQVHFLGNRSDMPCLYNIADVFVMASYREGLSRAIMEAMASGLPCLVSNIRGNNDLVVEGKGGYLANPRSEKDFAEKINLLNDRDRRMKMKEYNYDAIKKYALNNVIENIVEIYKELI